MHHILKKGLNELTKLDKLKCIPISECDEKLIRDFYIQTTNHKNPGYLEEYLKSGEALKDELRRKNRTYIVVDLTVNCIVCYFSLHAGSIHYRDYRYGFRAPLVVMPGIELAMFGVNDGYRRYISGISIGEFCFKRFIAPKVYDTAEMIGVQVLYLFALNQPGLIRYYTEKLGFIRPTNAQGIERWNRTITPSFDRGCIFMFQKI